MTPEELYRYDVTGYLLIEDAIAPAFLEKLQERMDYWEKEAHAILLQQDEGANPDIMILGEGALRLVPGSHKANFPVPDGDVSDLEIEITMKAGSVLLFTHDARHGSLNTTEKVRHVVIFTYCPQEISNSYVGDSLYDRLFDQAEEESWLKYLLRHPHGFLQTHSKPAGSPYVNG
jgi:hypothetical protein